MPTGHTGGMLLGEVVRTSVEVAATPARGAKTRLVADLLATAAADGPLDVELAAGLLAGAPRQRRTGVGWASLRARPEPAAVAALTLAGLDGALDALELVAGPGAQARRAALLVDLLGAATAAEQDFLAALLTGELRQGALEAVVVDATALAAGVPAADVRRAVMLSGDAAGTARLALLTGADGLAAVRLQVGRAVQPMLASSAPSVAEALARTGEAGVETKLDGIRVQVHRSGPEVLIFSRSLDDLTDRLPEVVAAASALACTSAVLDGEVLAIGEDGRPRPFQETSSRVARKGAAARLPLQVVFFDLLHLDGRDLLRCGGAERWAALDALVPAARRVTRVLTGDPGEGDAALRAALAAGHEGVVVKAVGATYDAGRRGAGWVKVKPVHTLDLVVLGAEWGHGRRRGWLSNLHLGCRGRAVGEFVMLGKTFKGLTDEVLRWQTERLLELAEGPTDGWVVPVRPELVVEIAVDGLQRSTRYPGGVAMRFARVVRYREDKSAAEADDLAAVLRLGAAPGDPQSGAGGLDQ